ncbi:hypothetical protein EDB92DRAFT_1815394 [Lactarius akahatsu]|uniref:Uncharacterized protein n=1 Tax=Lactarius akahatsu TaxID=416441 RepID=A0AAD4LK60_9AGAM|nr:hypothetical protein EDB92DRAFT_1815394 [Lactarius akahatsu]
MTLSMEQVARGYPQGYPYYILANTLNPLEAKRPVRRHPPCRRRVVITVATLHTNRLAAGLSWGLLVLVYEVLGFAGGLTHNCNCCVVAQYCRNYGLLSRYHVHVIAVVVSIDWTALLSQNASSRKK